MMNQEESTIQIQSESEQLLVGFSTNTMNNRVREV